MEKYLLNGMEVDFFFSMYLIAFFGMIMWFASDIPGAIKNDPSTPYKFSWKALFVRGAPRLIANLIVMFFCITNYSDMMKLVLSVGGSVLPVDFNPELNSVSAFLFIGVGCDTIVKKVIGFGKEGLNKLFNSKK